MTKLSPKAMRFVDAAVIQSESDQIRAVWGAFKREPAEELSDEVARAVLRALQQAERHLRDGLESSSLGEDRAADISNDLGFICAIQRDLQRQVESGVGENQPAGSRHPGATMDDMDHVWAFLKRLGDRPQPNYRKLIESRLKGFKHWNPDKIGRLRELVDTAYREAKQRQVGTAEFELESHSGWLDVLAQARKNLS